MPDSQTSWDVIRATMTAPDRPGSVGALRNLLRASEVFLALEDHLSDAEAAMRKFNEDEDLRHALLNYRILTGALP